MSKRIGKKVFVAAVPPDMSSFKENLILELEHNGYVVGGIDGNIEDADSSIEFLEQYDFAVHILSDQEKVVFPNGKGIQEQQIQYSVQHFLSRKLISDSEEEAFNIFAWHPKSRSENMFEEEHLSPHLRKIQQLEEVELLRTNFEEFKYYLFQKLKSNSSISVEEQFIKGDEGLSIYFLYDISDDQQAQKYVDYLKKRGYLVYSSQFEGEIMEIRQMHTNYLKKFDVAVIFAEKAGVNWVNMKIMDILKSPGLGREKEITGKALIMSASKAKMCPLAQRGFEIIELREDMMEDEMDNFLSRIL